jgi:predicted nuclease of predicted toxin-antitoxin system
MRLIIDMSLSPQWVQPLRSAGHDVAHWSEIGRAAAPDTEIMQWARENAAVVFTHDLDFSHILALTQAAGPSVIQIRTQDISPARAAQSLLEVLARFADELARGSLIVIDEVRQRVRVLPLQR